MKRKILPYNPKLQNLPAKLRKNPTKAEYKLWNLLRNKQIKGYKFRRQVPIDNFIVDFFCIDLMLAIEIDGSSHADKLENDIKRQKKLEGFNITFLRFTESDVLINPEGITMYILDWIDKIEGTA
jgi:very-short-patch-repair endonuclease